MPERLYSSEACGGSHTRVQREHVVLVKAQHGDFQFEAALCPACGRRVPVTDFGKPRGLRLFGHSAPLAVKEEAIHGD